MGVTQLPAPRGPEEGRGREEKKKAGNMKRRGFLLGNMGRGSVCWISESCGQYYPISCDSLTQEMRRLWWKEKPGWNSENIQLRPSETVHRSFFSCFLKKKKLNGTQKHSHACRHASGMFLYLIGASQNREAGVDIAERLRRYCWLLYGKTKSAWCHGVVTSEAPHVNVTTDRQLGREKHKRPATSQDTL